MSDDGIWSAELGNWALSAEGTAACKAACEFAQRVGLNVTSSEVCAIVIAAHEAEAKTRSEEK